METTPQNNSNAMAMAEKRVNNFDGMYLFGVICCAVSFSFLCLCTGGKNRTAITEGWFFVNYGIFILLLITSIVRNIFGVFNPDRHPMIFPILIAGLISCFSLNQTFTIFYSSAGWLQVLLIITSIAVLLLPFQNKLNKTFQYTIDIITGFALMLYLYYTVFLIPFYPLSLLAILFAGLGIHSFIPLLLLINVAVFYFKRAEKMQKRLVFASIFLVMATTISYTMIWNVRTNKINAYLMEEALLPPSDYSEWINIAQKIPADKLTKKIILTDLLYVQNDFGNWDFFALENNIGNAEATLTHDPLIVVCGMFSNSINLETNDKIKIIESIFDARHLTENRLWTGKNLTTSSVVTNIRIYPSQHLAYTEKTLTINNNHKGWGRPQEAIYTFYLPEGAAVSSLSLWVNGKEEKAALTTKSKAVQAYNTVVGVEARDPSVVHWQEGNRVSVRVFPCTNIKDRRIKIGITSPLQQTGDNYLAYNNITFKGPSAKGSKELIQVQYMDNIQQLTQSKKLKLIGNNTYKTGRTYSDDLEIKFLSPAIKTTSFTFNNKTYQIFPYKTTHTPTTINSVYLDINKSWTKNEFNHLINSIKNKKIYVYSDEIMEITAENKDDIFDILSKNNFSLFPLYAIKNPETSLLITKNEEQSPNLNEIKETLFYKKLMDFLQQGQTVNVISISNSLSPYLKTLKEYRAILVDNQSIDDAIHLINKNIFIKNIEDDKTVLIDNAKILIKESDTAAADSLKAPDHLFRLFACNTILKDMKTKFVTDTLIDENSIKLASLANVVTPVSSLIVLETQADYDKFDIKKDKDALENANMHNDGAVPEPHEWALIIIGILTLFYLQIKRKQAHAGINV
jgi:XrtN system VIT domain protein